MSPCCIACWYARHTALILSAFTAQAKFVISLVGGVALICCTRTFFAVAAIPHPPTDEDEEQQLSWSSGSHVHVLQICRSSIWHFLFRLRLQLLMSLTHCFAGHCSAAGAKLPCATPTFCILALYFLLLFPFASVIFSLRWYGSYGVIVTM
jgi:hypothetical protein